MEKFLGFMRKYLQHLLLLLVIIVLISLAYKDLPNSFFEQDEWHSFGYYNYLLSLNTTDFFMNALRSGPFNHFTPLSLFSKLTMFKFFGLDAQYYFYVSIVLHILTSVSVYIVIYTIIDKKIPAFLGSLFFAVNSSHYQAVTWIGTFEGAEASVLFGVLSLISFLLYKKDYNIRLFYLSLFSLFIALLFKETAISIFLLISALILMNKNMKTKGNLMGVVGLLVVYLLLRFNYLFFNEAPVATALDQSKVSFISAFFYNFITVPVKIFSQLSFPNDFLINLTNRKNFLIIPGNGPWSLEHAFFYDLISFSFGLAVVAIIYLITKRVTSKFPVYFGLSLVIATILPLLLLKKYLTYLDSRYLYQATVGFSIIVAFVSLFCFSNMQIIKKVGKFIVGGFCLVYLLIILTHFYSLQRLVKKNIEIGETRKDILMQIKAEYPKLPQEVLFYTESDTPYYGVLGEEKILPFQSGFGQTLLIWYSREAKFPREFFENDFLWDIRAQGYEKVGSSGFGYFRDFELLKKTVKDYNIPVNSIIAFSWSIGGNRLVNISNGTRIKISNELK